MSHECHRQWELKFGSSVCLVLGTRVISSPMLISSSAGSGRAPALQEAVGWWRQGSGVCPGETCPAAPASPSQASTFQIYSAWAVLGQTSSFHPFLPVVSLCAWTSLCVFGNPWFKLNCSVWCLVKVQALQNISPVLIFGLLQVSLQIPLITRKSATISLIT